jgi:hypothetical protein
VPGYRSPSTKQQVGIFLSKHVPGWVLAKRTEFGKTVRYYRFPALAEMREKFLKMNQGYRFPAEPEIVPGAAASSPPVPALAETGTDMETSSSIVVPLRRSA